MAQFVPMFHSIYNSRQYEKWREKKNTIAFDVTHGKVVIFETSTGTRFQWNSERFVVQEMSESFA